MISNWKSHALVLFNVLKRVYHKNIFIKQELTNTINFLVQKYAKNKNTSACIYF